MRHLLAAYRSGQILATTVIAELQISRSRFYELYADYLRACAQGNATQTLLSLGARCGSQIRGPPTVVFARAIIEVAFLPDGP